MMPSLQETVFHCPLCAGPLIAWQTDAGQRTDCPHCLRSIYVPSSGEPVDKNTFEEPSGLRRILQEVRDQEWESMRRKLRVAKAQSAWLEEELRRVREELSAHPVPAEDRATMNPAELAALRGALAEALVRADKSGQEAAAERQQHEQTRRLLAKAEQEAAAAQEELARLKAQRAGRRTSPSSGSALVLA